MKVRCGACQAEVQIPGPGRFNCPSCGSPNEVRPPNQGATGGVPAPDSGQFAVPPPQPPPEPPSPKVTCDECTFSFIVGDIEVASCPNCGAEVPVSGRGGSE